MYLIMDVFYYLEGVKEMVQELETKQEGDADIQHGLPEVHKLLKTALTFYELGEMDRAVTVAQECILKVKRIEGYIPRHRRETEGE